MEPNRLHYTGSFGKEDTVNATDEDRRAFVEATRDVKPLKDDNRAPFSPPKPKPKARRRRAADADVLRDSLLGKWHEHANGEVEYARAELSARAFRQLRLGKYSIEAEIDLHGMTRAQAEHALRAFLMECARLDLGCVRVIHGKGARSGPGGPVLKYFVHDWLAQWDYVLGYASAGQKHGGNGAVLVLLRRR
jgi:DNA-nicking Smr family endonuclease